MANSKKEPGICKLGNRWEIDTFYHGQRLRDSCATLPAARKNLLKMKTLIDEARYLEKKRVPKETLGEFASEYLNWCADVRQKDLRSEKQRIGLIVYKPGKDTLLAKVTRATIESFQAERASSMSRRNTLLKPATVNREMAALKHLLSKAVEWDVLDRNPAIGVKLFKETNRRLRYLSVEECRALLEACPTETLRRVVILALHTGMRKGEILNLKWQNVNLREGFIELIEQKNGERSVIPLSDYIIGILKSIPRRLDSEFVFAGKNKGEPFCDLKRQFAAAVKGAKLEGVTFHVLRHTAASLLTMNGVDLKTVQEIPRHKSITMTQRYAHLSPEHQKAAVEALATALQGDRTAKAETA